MASWEHPPSWSWWRTLQVAGASPRLLQTLSDLENRAPVRDLQGLLVLWTGPSWTSGPASSLFQTLWPGTFTCGLLKVTLQAGSGLLLLLLLAPHRHWSSCWVSGLLLSQFAGLSPNTSTCGVPHWRSCPTAPPSCYHQGPKPWRKHQSSPEAGLQEEEEQEVFWVSTVTPSVRNKNRFLPPLCWYFLNTSVALVRVISKVQVRTFDCLKVLSCGSAAVD